MERSVYCKASSSPSKTARAPRQRKRTQTNGSACRTVPSRSANAAGAELFCHPNTVRYRMRRIEAGTGRVLANPGDVAELVTAVRAWRELPHS